MFYEEKIIPEGNTQAWVLLVGITQARLFPVRNTLVWVHLDNGPLSVSEKLSGTTAPCVLPVDMDALWGEHSVIGASCGEHMDDPSEECLGIGPPSGKLSGTGAPCGVFAGTVAPYVGTLKAWVLSIYCWRQQTRL